MNAERKRVLDTSDTDPASLPAEWSEWECLDAEEKGSVLQDYFNVVRALTEGAVIRRV